MRLRILHFSDIHFGCENKAALAAARDYAIETGFDLLAVTGDVTQFGWTNEFQAASAFLKSLPEPQLSTPGNHDTPYLGVFDRLFRPFARYAAHVGPASGEGYVAPGLNAQAINTARGVQVRANWSKGQISLSEAERVCARLSKSEPDALRVVLCHHPLMEVTGGPMTGRVWRGERGAEILAQGGADLILTGHVHMPFAHPLPFTDQRTYAVGASTLSLRERNCPAGFNVIEADPGCIQVTALGWTGTGFEAQRTWGFDRRRREAPASVVTPESDPRSDPRPVRP